MLSEQTLLELGQILKEEYGVEISPQNVSEMGHSLVGYFDLLAKINHREVEVPEVPTKEVVQGLGPEVLDNSNKNSAVGTSD